MKLDNNFMNANIKQFGKNVKRFCKSSRVDTCFYMTIYKIVLRFPTKKAFQQINNLLEGSRIWNLMLGT